MLPFALLLAGGTTYAGIKTYKKFWGTEKNILSKNQPENKNSIHLQVVKESPGDGEVCVFDQEVDHYLSVSAGAVGLAGAGSLFFPPLSIISVPISLYVSWPIFKKTYQDIVKKHQLKYELIDSLAIIVSLATGYYFITALSNCVYFSASKILSGTRDHTTKKLINIFTEHPRYVWIIKNGAEIEIPFEELHAEDIIIVNAGEIISADGIIIEGTATVDQHVLTGESQPHEKNTGEQVLATTVVLTGRICIKVAKTGTETLAAQVGEILNNTSEFELSMQTRSEKLADKSVLPTLMVGALALVTLGKSSSAAVIYANFSDVNRIVSPLGMLNFLAAASQDSILIKDGRVLEMLNQVDTVVFDKTGTLTLNQFSLSNIYTCDGIKENDLLGYAATAEYKQKHPIAETILKAAEERNLELSECAENSYEIGYGIKVEISGQLTRVGSIRFMDQEEIPIPENINAVERHCHEQGCSTVYVSINNKLAGLLELRPVIRPEAKAMIQKLRKRNLSVYIVSGDQKKPTEQLAEELGIDNYFSETLPHQKSELVEKFQQEGKSVCFIGDGINDSVALKKANVSISLSGASSAATDIAQIIFMDKTIGQLDRLFELAKKFDTNQKMSMATVFVPGILCVGGIFFLHVGIFGSMIFYNISAVAGVTNAFLPKILQKNKNTFTGE